MTSLFRYGSDWEFFAGSANLLTTTLVPSEKVIPKVTKENPAILGDFLFHQDNASFELATPIYETLPEFFMGLNHMKSMAIAFCQENKLHLLEKSAALLSKDQEREFPSCRIFGCAPDMDAWNGEVNPPPSLIKAKGLRAAGLHIHMSIRDPVDFGFDVENPICYRAFALAIHTYFSINGFKYPSTRNKLYGRGVAFRPKPEYPGVEYRGLDSAVLRKILAVGVSRFIDFEEKILHFYHLFNDEKVINEASNLITSIEFINEATFLAHFVDLNI